MQLLIYIVMFLVGLVAIVKGADFLTDGGAAIAHKMGVPTIVVGLTIVAIGSSLPEFVVSVVSALEGHADMAVGNIVGSNIFNILAILGITALVAPISISWGNIRNDVPFIMLCSFVLLVTAIDGTVTRNEGLLMLCLFLVFFSYSLAITKQQDAEQPAPVVMTTLRASLYCLIGLVTLLVGGKMLVEGGVGAARLLGMPESLVALTFISIGTSAPELAASIMAARKGDHGMAIGNVVGSVVFNVFFVLGIAATLQNLPLNGVGRVDLGVLMGSSVLLWIFCRFGKQRFAISRVEGGVLVLIAVLYYAWLGFCR